LRRLSFRAEALNRRAAWRRRRFSGNVTGGRFSETLRATFPRTFPLKLFLLLHRFERRIQRIVRPEALPVPKSTQRQRALFITAFTSKRRPSVRNRLNRVRAHTLAFSVFDIEINERSAELPPPASAHDKRARKP
jgi:hypothetical protein